MKKINVIFILILISYSNIFSQESVKEFGKISIAEVEMSEYSKDKNADAVVLFDKGISRFVRTEYSFDVLYERTTRIKILSEAGVKWAQIEIPFYQEGEIYEKVTNIDAYSYNIENGGLNKTQLKISNTYDERMNNFWLKKKFAIPGVKVGSVIEYTYKIYSPYKFNFRDWEFQWKIPVIYSEYETQMIPFYEYTWLLQGANKFDSQKSYVDKGLSRQFGSINYQDMIYQYVMKDVPAFNSEEFISSINDYIIKIDFQLSKIYQYDGSKVDILTTWEDLVKDLIKDPEFGKYASKSEKLAAKLIDIPTLMQKSETERFNYVIDYVKHNYSWNKHLGKYVTKSPNKFVEEKNGNCADINLFAIGLLRSLGIDAHPVLISTRENGKIKTIYPFVQLFNYVVIVAKIDNQTWLSDATSSLCLNNRIPEHCINDLGLIMKNRKDKSQVEWIGLQSTIPSTINTQVGVEFAKDKSLQSTVTRSATEYDALRYRDKYFDSKKEIKKDFETSNLNINDSTIEIENLSDISKPYIFKYVSTTNPEIVNGKIYISPFSNTTISENPLKQNVRTYPMDMTYSKKRTFQSTVTIPDGFKIEYLPRDKKLANDLFELNYSIQSDEKNILIQFDYFFKKAIYTADQYSQIKYYFNEIVSKGTDKIVLVKK
ncbi:MAG: DUF3857 and transglutaminase domain-containing protein [Bacteroidales bacterium]|nr:DUF3857 and transglutaminase domain-containing protein [Bacteroidales bacterium]